MTVSFEQQFPFGTLIVQEHHPGTFEVTIKSRGFKALTQLTKEANTTTILFDVKGECKDGHCRQQFNICCADCTISCLDRCRKVTDGRVMKASDCTRYQLKPGVEEDEDDEDDY
jgi:hypothetical protein